MLKLVQSAHLPSIFPKAWGTGDNQCRHWNLSTLLFAHACSWKRVIRISLCTKCQNTYSGAVWFRLIVHWAWWSVVRCAITQPDGLLSAEASDRSPGRARGYLQAKEFCSVPPSAGMNPSGGGLLRTITAPWPLQLFVQVSLGLFFGSRQCKVRKTFNPTKIRECFLLCVFVCLCLLWLCLGVR